MAKAKGPDSESDQAVKRRPCRARQRRQSAGQNDKESSSLWLLTPHI